MSSFVVGLDLGQAQDHTAIAVVEHDLVGTGEVVEWQRPIWSGLGHVVGHEPMREERTADRCRVRHLERLPLGTPYPRVVRRVADLLETPPLGEATPLVVDATGVGAPVVDLLRESRIRSEVEAVLITGADAVADGGWAVRVPKRSLVSTLQVLLQDGRLRVAEGLPEATTLVNELLAFRVKISETGHDSYGAWREGSHDDQVLAVALACWRAIHAPQIYLY